MSSTTPMKPVLASDWWQLCPNPDLPELGGGRGEVVDHGIFRAADGTWQLWTQIRGTPAGRVFYRWQGGTDITQPDWEPKGICWRADPGCGESHGTGAESWVHAPYVARAGEGYLMYYGGGPGEGGAFQICAAASQDGVRFERILEDGRSRMFEGPGVARDPMAITHDGAYILYYAADVDGVGVIAARTSPRPTGRAWSESRVVSRGGFCGTGRASQQCPFVVRRGGFYYLFKMAGSHLFRTGVYRSTDPLDFGEEDEYLVTVLPASAAEVVQADDATCISSLIPGYDGVRLARLEWEEEGVREGCHSFRPGSGR